jgi:Ammonium Transporter Family
LAVGFLASPSRLFEAYGVDSHPGWVYNPLSDNLLTAQVAGSAFIIAWTLGTMFPFFYAINKMGWFRVNSLEEYIGLDASYSGTAPLSLHEESSNNEELRLAAYQQRFEEKKQMRQSNPVRNMTVNEFLSERIAGGQSKNPASQSASDSSSDDGSTILEARHRMISRENSVDGIDSSDFK